MPFPEYASVFLEELEDQIACMEEMLLRLEREGHSSEAIQSLFRAAHTIKGSSAAMGCESIKRLTHEMESLLDALRGDRIRITERILNTLLHCTDHLKLLKQDFENGNISGPIDSFIADLQACMQRQEAPEPDAPATFQIEVRLSPLCEMKFARCLLIRHQLAELGDILETEPPLAEESDEASYDRVRFLVRSSRSGEHVERRISTMMDIEEVSIAGADSPSLRMMTGPAAMPEPASPKETRQKHTIRVKVDRLDDLMNLVGELVIEQTRIAQVKTNLNRKYATDPDIGELQLIADHVSRLTENLQEIAMQVRMQPIDHLFNRFPRMVRDLSQNLGKEIDFVMEGGDTELDRTVIEEIGDPLIHLIRNAIDHGIESADERSKLGKPRKGRVTLKAWHQDNQVVISVEDDGRGLNAERLKQKAVEKGVIAQDAAEQLGEQQAYQLIFEPGFSTASAVSDISGRGVGMDIVRSYIERMNGLIQIQSDPGKGTAFQIKLPLTLAITTGLLLSVQDRTYIIPMNNVIEIVRVPVEQMESVQGTRFISVRDQVIPVIKLCRYLQLPESPKAANVQLVIVGLAEKQIALEVDALLGNQEVVIKSLGSYIGRVDHISGATILGNGRVALILDAAGFFR